MAGTFTGMDIAQVRALASVFEKDAAQIDQLSKAVTAKLHATSWVGKDRTKFESEWNSQGKLQLAKVAEMLKIAAAQAKKNALEQEQASNS